MKTTTIVKDTDFGLYFIVLPNGRAVGDSDGQILNVYGRAGRQDLIEKMEDAARGLGLDEFSIAFSPGHRRVTANERDDQMERMLDGKLPDWLDPGHIE